MTTNLDAALWICDGCDNIYGREGEAGEDGTVLGYEERKRIHLTDGDVCACSDECEHVLREALKDNADYMADREYYWTHR